MIGSTIGPYTVVAKLGEGGMGEVYRARDTRLDRDVAIKVLSRSFGADQDRVSRFEREARVLAALNHPNIAVIHGVERIAGGHDGTSGTALILELVEGETLDDRLARGPLSVNDALGIAGQVAGALDSAHGKGIIHRDLKPSNVKITPDGRVKVLDFGLAKTGDVDGGPSTATVTATGMNVIVGTAAYMSPEQARGGPVDKRTDVWALGVLIYEMVTGRRPFDGASFHDAMAAVLTATPDWSRLPPQVQPLVRACLERDLTRRLRDAGDVRFLLEAAAAEDVRPPSHPRRPLTAAALIALAAAAGAIATWTWVRPSRMSPALPQPQVAMMTLLPAGVSVARGPGLAASIALSPDGRTVVVAGTSREGPRLYRRSIDRLDATPIAGTERGSSPFFSPDGAWVGFYADGRLKRVPASGGASADIVTLSAFPAGASWSPDDRIVFSAGAFSPLQMVDANGGAIERISKAAVASRPAVFGDGRAVLFSAGGWVHLLDRDTGTETRLVQGTSPRYADGHIILARGTTLLAAPFDHARRAVTGPVVPLLENVANEPGTAGGLSHYAVSPSGSLAYVPATETYSLVLVNRDGTDRIISDGQQSLRNPRFSADGGRVVVAAARPGDKSTDLWIHDLAAGTATRVTFEGAGPPVWSPDGSSVSYSRQSAKPPGIYDVRADGSGDVRHIVGLDAPHWLVGWTPDHQTLAYGVMEGSLSSIVSRRGDETQRVVGPGQTWGGRLSRDGRWLVYYSLDSGNFEIYVTPFPKADTRWLIANGTDPTWSPDGSEVYYRSGARLMAARIERSNGVRVLSDRIVVEPFQPPAYDDYDIRSDGTVVMVRPSSLTQGREVTMVLNWFSELRRLTGQ